MELGHELEGGTHLIGGVGASGFGEEPLNDVRGLACSAFDWQAGATQNVGGDGCRLLRRQVRQCRGQAAHDVARHAVAKRSAEQVHYARHGCISVDAPARYGLHLIEDEALRMLAHAELRQELQRGAEMANDKPVAADTDRLQSSAGQVQHLCVGSRA